MNLEFELIASQVPELLCVCVENFTKINGSALNSFEKFLQFGRRI